MKNLFCPSTTIEYINGHKVLTLPNGYRINYDWTDKHPEIVSKNDEIWMDVSEDKLVACLCDELCKALGYE